MKKKDKIYILEGKEEYENSFIIDVYINKENAYKALNRIKSRQFYDKLNSNYSEYLSYYIRVKEIKDLFDEKET